MIFLVVPAILLLDQCSKFFISRKIALSQSVPLIKGILYLTLVHNRGAAFGVLKGQVPFFILASFVAVILIVLNFRKERRFIYTLSLGLILAGAIGNLIDRLCFGYVIDFIDLRVWPVFNVADSSITVGAVLLAWNILVPKQVVTKSPSHQVTKS